MNRTRIVLAAILAAGGLAAAPAAAPAASAAPGWNAPRRACAPAHGHVATCFVTYRTRVGAHIKASRTATTIEGITATDVRSAYKLPGRGGAGKTIAIVDAQDEPKAEADLAVYRTRFGLPPCTTANGCLRKVNQSGKPKPLPDADPSGWGIEIELDLQAASAACPDCKLLLVEASSPMLADLGTAVNTAVRLGATAVSNSYGSDEFDGMPALGATFYRHPGVALVASSGDSAFPSVSFPAVLPQVIAVGGTTLTRAASTSRGYRETVWNSASSGCSAYLAKPSWQHDTHCLERTVADVSAVAQGYAIYDSDLAKGSGWMLVDGTSVSSPLIAAMIARSPRPGLASAATLYANPRAFFDVTKGSNGYCGGDYLCTGKAGYDAPTGVGTPNGVAGL